MSAHNMRFTFATEGKSFYRTLSAFRATTVGNELLQRRPDLGGLCCNRAMLQACPTGSLGRRYAEFMISHGLDPESYLRLAIEHSTQFKDPEQIWFHTRIDASHDLRHVLCGYQPDVFGEVCLCWFRYAQAGHCGVFVLASLGFLSLILKRPSLMVFRSTLEAYRRGQRSQLLDLLPWEDQLAQPLAVQRALLGPHPSRSITPLRSLPEEPMSHPRRLFPIVLNCKAPWLEQAIENRRRRSQRDRLFHWAFFGFDRNLRTDVRDACRIGPTWRRYAVWACRAVPGSRCG